jgi:elongation factor Ts
MVEITASMVRALREKTDAPMMECKKALAEAGGDAAKAEELLRVRLGHRASRSAGRVAAEGAVAVYVSEDARIGAIVEVNCETDFVAKNAEFLDFAGALARLVAAHGPADAAALSALELAGASVEDARAALAGKIGENIRIRRFARLEASGRLGSYVHGGARIGVLVDVRGGDAALAKDLAMHIAAARPIAISAEEVPAQILERERAIAAAKAAESGKPPAIVEKMIEGSVQKFLKEVTLLGQSFVRDEKQSVAALLRAKGASVAAFVLYVVGEGIEKSKGDFAAEVAAQVARAG